MRLLVLAVLLAGPASTASKDSAARAPADPLPRGSRVLVVNASLAPPALDEVAAARGWKVDSAHGATPAIVAARAGRPKLLVVSAGLVDAQKLSALRAAAPGAKVILTRKEGEALPELPDALALSLEVLPAPYEPASLEAAVVRAFGPRAPPSEEDKRKLLEVRAAQKEKKDLARRIAALTVDRILAMAEPLSSESAALEQLMDRLRKKAAGPERLSVPERDLLLASAALELGLDGYASRPEGDQANLAAPALRRAGFGEEAASLEEAWRLLARRGRMGRAVDRLNAREALAPEERRRWGELAAVLDRSLAGAGAERRTHQLLEYARAQRKSLQLDRRAPASSVAAAGAGAARP